MAQSPLILAVRGFSPQLGEGTFLAPNSTVVGDVVMGTECSVWFNAVVRGDVNSIRIGQRCNIQDGAILHCTYQTAATTLGDDVSIGHGAIVHGCTVEDRVLIGMGAKVLDHAYLEHDVLLGAGALVPPGMRLESGYLYTGLPAQKRRPLTEAELELIRRTARNYVMYAGWFDQPTTSNDRPSTSNDQPAANN